MRINRLLVIGLMATSLLASCKKDINSDDQGNGITFTARTEQNRDGSRTYIDPEGLDQDDSADVLWAEDDHILVSNGSETLDFGLTDGDHTTEGTFYTGGDHDDFFVHDYLALYPSANAEDVPNTLDFQTGIATFHLPSTQVLDRENSFANKTMPMVCHDTDEDLDFKNVFGGLIIPLMIDEEFYDMWGIESIRVDRVVLTSLKADDKLWGTFTADCRSDNPLPTHISGDGGNTLTLTLTCDLTLGTEEYTNFIFIVPPGSLSEGFKVEAYYGPAKVYEELFDWATEAHGFAIPRRVLMKVATHLYNDNVFFEPYVTPFTIQPTYISIHSAWAMGGNWGAYDPSDDYAEYNVPSYASFVYAKASDVGDDPGSLLVLGGANVHVVPCTGEYISPSGNNYYGAVGFEAPLEGLEEDQIYYVRSYVVNPYDEGYGEPVPFATRYDYYGHGNNGKSRGVFSVSDDTQVYFSMGNLQYRAQPSTWRFADYQFEFVGAGVFPTPDDFYDHYGVDYQYNSLTVWGNVFANGQHPHDEGNGIQSDNNQNGENYSEWIDIYGYGCSNYAHRARLWHPWEVEFFNYYNPYIGLGHNNFMGNIESYFAYDDPDANLYDHSGEAEWGYNAISNGGNTENSGWRTLTGCQNTESGDYRGEWRYLLNGRQTSNQYVCAQTVLCVRGDFRRTIDPNAGEPNSTLYEVASIHFSDSEHHQRDIEYCGYQVGGLILFPDGFDPVTLDLDAYFDFTGIITQGRGLNKFEGNYYYSDELSEAEWSLLEHFGAVFLPETGIRVSPDEQFAAFYGLVDCKGILLNYWSSSCPVMKNVYGTDIPAWNGLMISEDSDGAAFNGFASVRLVKNAR